MNLDEFISESFKGIIKGVKDAQPFAKQNTAIINPDVEKNKISSGARVKFYDNKDGARIVSDIDFDIAVTIVNQKENGIGGGITVLGIALGGKQATRNNDEIVSRIKFTVSIVFPDSKPEPSCILATVKQKILYNFQLRLYNARYGIKF